MTAEDFEGALRKFRSDAAADALRRTLWELEAKFDPNQPRAPVGSSNGGQWVPRGSGGGSGVRKVPRAGLKPARSLGAPVARTLIKHRGALAATARAGGLPALGGGVALARAVGDFDHRTTGREKTPFLKLPAPKLRLSITAEDGDDPSDPPRFSRGFYDPAEKARVDEECDALERDDYIKCDTYAAMYARNKKERATIWRFCEATITERQAECRREGGFSAVRTPLYAGRR